MSRAVICGNRMVIQNKYRISEFIFFFNGNFTSKYALVLTNYISRLRTLFVVYYLVFFTLHVSTSAGHLQVETCSVKKTINNKKCA
jgi:hypothetical protein